MGSVNLRRRYSDDRHSAADDCSGRRYCDDGPACLVHQWRQRHDHNYPQSADTDSVHDCAIADANDPDDVQLC